MASIQTGIELNDNFTSILNNVISSVNLAVAAMENMQGTMNTGIDTGSLEGARAEINQATMAVNELERELSELSDSAPSVPSVPSASSVWQTNGQEVFTNSGMERFDQEVQSANQMLNTLNSTQQRIQQTAVTMDIFPDAAVQNLSNMGQRLQSIQSRIQQISSNPVNMGTDEANAELEQLRAQLNAAVREQEILNHAVDEMDIQAANEAYLRLSQIVDNTERHIRDNADEQGRLNNLIKEGADSAGHLKNMIASAVGAFVGMAGIRKAISWVEDCTDAFNVQRNAELQLMSVLSNMLDAEYVSQFMVETEVTADTSEAIAEINGIQDRTDDVIVTVSASTKALQNAFDTITEKASEIQSRGIYGDEAMIAGAAEFSTYFSDTDAITMMMDTLSDYAMGMSGGGELDSTAMVDYATGLGKIMSGSYEAMTKKGFEFTEAQKAIIEGTATQEQIIAGIGEKYLNASEDVRAAAAINAVIAESWDGLYESMSNTPEGKIIQMTNAFGDMKEVIGGKLYPYVILFVDAITSHGGMIQTVLNGITLGLQVVMGVLSWLLDGAMDFAQAIIDNWSWICPIIYGIIGALIVYNAVMGIGWLTTMKDIAIKGAHAIASAAQTAAIVATMIAQEGLNAVLAACPITFIVMAIIALIAAFYAAVAAINYFAGTSYSATGIIAGLFATLGAHVINAFVVPAWNGVAAFVNFLGNVFNDPVAAVKVLIYDMCLTVLGYIQNLARGIETLLNKIPGVTIDITSGLDSLYSNLEAAQKAVKDESGWVEYVGKMDYVDYGDAWNKGYSTGEGIEEAISDFDISDLFGAGEIPSVDDYASGFKEAMDANGLSGNMDDIAGDTGSIKDSLDCTQEDLKYLRDIAEQEAVNRFTIAEVKVEQTNHNNINSGMDLDGVVSGLTDAVNDAVDSITEGVHE